MSFFAVNRPTRSAKSAVSLGERAHAFSRVVEAKVVAVAADDGLLVWQQDDGLHVAGQQRIEFAEPFAAPSESNPREPWAGD